MTSFGRRATMGVLWALMFAAVPSVAGPRGLEMLLGTIDRAEPLDGAKLDAVLGLDLHCGDSADCERGPLTTHGLKITYVDFRQYRNGTLLELTGFPESCLAVDRAKKLYPAGEYDQGCTDATSCPYHVVKRPWGQLSLGLPRTDNEPKCIITAIFDMKR